MSKKILRTASLSAVFLLLTACSPFGPIVVAPIKTYTLTDISAVTPSAVQTHKSLTIMPVTAVRGLDTNAMIYESQPYLLAPFAENAWIAPPASMFNALLGRALQQTNAFTAVVPGPAFSNTDYTVNVVLLELDQDFTVDPSEIVLSLGVSLIDNQTNTILANQVFSSRTPTKTNTPYGGVLAANQAANQIMQQISQFLIAQVIQASLSTSPR